MAASRWFNRAKSLSDTASTLIRQEAAEQAGYPELKETPGLSKSEFAEKIRNLD